ncbi:MAG: UDP-N-acetylmuramoyl-L-alanyl-D-glutamate--2,6-diaminopimelate ligase, partial [Phycisphaerae bacterium]|nr:UDP-N-acetylmuramoyl-L-alanyl-D-glutamate--2,6-diaminopimelate ligase [Phycisphaerae bacterium]
GKSTVTHLIREILTAARYKAAMLGTISYETGRRSTPAVTTTPDPVSLAEMTAEMVEAGKTHLVMEVSSHALDQRRTAGIDFSNVVLTNISGDHLDYHKTMAQYTAAKRRLFEQAGAGSSAVINRDDPSGAAFAAATEAEVLWYGLSPAAKLRGRIERIDTAGTHFAMILGDCEVPVATPLIGRHNVLNCLAAAGACATLGVELSTVAEALAKVEYVPGRLQRVRVAAPYQVFVDYAHTDDAMENVLAALRPLTSGRVIVVFGCGGDRDRSKRPRMARIAERLADRIVITSDNPRSEDPQVIINEIVAGLSEMGRSRTDVVADRRAAIDLAIGRANASDVVLIAGKGHERYQVVGSERIDFDDIAVAAEAMRRLEGGQ